MYDIKDPLVSSYRGFVNRWQIIRFPRMRTSVCMNYFHLHSCIHVARISRECGDLRLRAEKAGEELQKVKHVNKHESARIRWVSVDIWKHLASMLYDTSKSAPQKVPNESFSSELLRIEQRLASVVNVMGDSAARASESLLKDVKCKHL